MCKLQFQLYILITFEILNKIEDEKMDKIESFKQRLLDKDNPPELVGEAISILTEYHDFLKEKKQNI